MTIAPGSRLGPYEVLGPLGDGRTYAYTYVRLLGDLYLAEGLK